MIEAIIFDMDGLLIDSEPFWKRAEREVFGSLGIDVTEDHSFITSRMTTKEVTEYWFSFKPWKNISLTDIEQQVINKVGELIDRYGQIMPGVERTLAYFKSSGYKIGLATNSPDILIPRVLKKLNINSYFDVTLSAEFVDKGKPSPDIYLKTAQILLVNPSQCIVFEDSKSGLAAAKAAGMFVAVVPEKAQYDHIEFDLADLKIGSFLDLHEDHIRHFNNMEIKYHFPEVKR